MILEIRSARLSGKDVRPTIERLLAQQTGDVAERAKYDWEINARPEQLPPEGDWQTWLLLAGRGAGKTRSGAEWVRGQVEKHGKRRIALIAATAADARDVIVEGESGILAVCPPWNKPVYEPTKRRVTWPNGALATLYSADEPDRLRGPQHDAAWGDEVSSWRDPAALDMLLLGLRLGKDPRLVVTTTPRPTRLIRELAKSNTTVVSRFSTYANRDNLAPAFFARIVKQYEGTRLGRQELNAEILEDHPGALWTNDLIESTRTKEHPALVRVVIGVDPSGSDSEGSAQCGIVVAGLGIDGHGYVLADKTARTTPHGWASIVAVAYRAYEADRVVAEINFGAKMVESTLRTVDPNIPFSELHASRGKQARAEPIAALYEQRRVHHVGGFPDLEDQMTCWVPSDPSALSPDRMDALAWVLTELMIEPEQIIDKFW